MFIFETAKVNLKNVNRTSNLSILSTFFKMWDNSILLETNTAIQ